MRPFPGGWRRSGPVGPTCSTCDVIHAASDVVAVGRFDPAGPRGYMPRGGGIVRATRGDVRAELCARVQS